jgi:(p)ppGpp synthase/HD superfamily hydrolase
MLSKDEIITKIRDFANAAHGGQTRKYSDDPYIVHPMRVMTLCSGYTDDICTLGAAILHDVVEDTPVTSEEILSFLETLMTRDQAQRTTQFVIELTDIYTPENYPRLNRRTRKEKEAERMSRISAEAQTVKYADIIDNTDVTRNDPHFAGTYLREASDLLHKMDRGNPLLREKALSIVQRCLQSLGGRVSSR